MLWSTVLRGQETVYPLSTARQMEDCDLFCITRGVVLDEEDKRFSLGFDTSLSSKKSPRGVFNSDEMQRKSGPGAVFDSDFNIG